MFIYSRVHTGTPSTPPLLFLLPFFEIRVFQNVVIMVQHVGGFSSFGSISIMIKHAGDFDFWFNL